MSKNNYEVKIFIPKKAGDLHYVYLYDKVSKKIIQKYYKGINVSLDPDERLESAEDMQRAIILKLKSGWLPAVKKETLPQFEVKEILICDAIEFALKSMEKRLEKKTVQSYSCTGRFFIDIVRKLKWQKFNLGEFEGFHIEKVMIAVSDDRKWTNNEYNKNLVYIKAIFSELVREKYIKINPAHGILSKKKGKVKGYETLTAQEQTKVITHFQKHFPNYAIWLKTLYHTGMRPAELRQVKCSMLNLKEDYFQLTEEITKTDDNRKIPIPEDLKKDLLKFDLSKKDNFLFGKHKERSAYDQKNFQPNPKQLSMNAANKIWKEEVIQNLGIDKKMYSQKHQKANHIILDGGSIEAVQRAFGHSNKMTTEIYAKVLEDLRLNEFKEKARDFK